MKRCHLTAVIWKEGSKYVSKCPELGVASYGANPDKAKTALEEAVELYLTNAKKLGLWEDLRSTLTSDIRYTAPFEIALAL